MKKFIYLLASLFMACGLYLSICFGQEDDEPKRGTGEPAQRDFDSPKDFFDTIVQRANLYGSTEVQNTQLNNVSPACYEALSVNSKPNFTITRTLCNIKKGIKPYLQYIIWAGLTGATILIIRNGFKLVTSTDRAKQIKEFQKNIIYIVIGVALIISFYRILDIFVSLINFVTE